MNVAALTALASPATSPVLPSSGGGPTEFGRMVMGQLRQVNAQQVHADELTQAFAAGKDVDVHRVVMATEEARLGMECVLQVRNKLIDAYQEVMRMQI